MSTAAGAVSGTTATPRRRVRHRRSPWRRLVRRIPFFLLVVIIIVFIGFPFYWALRSSLTPEGQLFTTPLHYWPTTPTLQNYRDAFSSGDFTHALLNSTIVAATLTIIALVLGGTAAYAVARFRFPGRNLTLLAMLSMTMFPQIAILGALYTLINKAHLYNTLTALIFSDLVLVLPLTTWILTSFMRQLPKDLEEAAYVDGATPTQAFYKVMLPLIAPGLVTAGLLAFITAWQEYLYALSFTDTPDKYTVTVAISSFTGKTGNAFQTPWGEIMAATMIVTVPLIVLTLVFQRRIISGLTAGAVKG
ncbi:MAG TPA: carbohydrate ABC transporter permease [Gaiellaceae bacterium]|nr:carbohydrate ABC transporter permease [Gaiellaceae bacterium]